MTLNESDRGWLADYEKARDALRGVRRTKSTSGVTAHITQPSNDNIDPSAFEWEPRVPPAPPPAPDEPPPLGGATPPGTPVVEVVTPPTSTGDPVAAKQFAAIVTFIVIAGVNAGREILANSDVELPDAVRAIAASDEHATQGVTFVAQAAERVAMKYGFRQIPMADEVVVGGAVAGSIFLVAHNYKRKKQQPTPPPPAPEKPDNKPDDKPKSTTPDVLRNFWTGGN